MVYFKICLSSIKYITFNIVATIFASICDACDHASTFTNVHNYYVHGGLEVKMPAIGIIFCTLNSRRKMNNHCKRDAETGIFNNVPNTLQIFFSLKNFWALSSFCLLYTSPSPRDRTRSRMPSSA